jgi:hypothetical protein
MSLLKITTTNERLQKLGIEQDKTYEIDKEQPIVIDMYKIKVPMKQKGKYRFALVNENEGELVD